MENAALTEHAQRVARQIVAKGYADVKLTKQHFGDYFHYRSLGFAGSFTSFLLARKVIDEKGVDVLNTVCPPVAETESEDRMSSAVFELSMKDLRPSGGKTTTVDLDVVELEVDVARAKAAAKKTVPEGRVIELPVDVLAGTGFDPVEVPADEEAEARAEEATQGGDPEDEDTLIFADTDPEENHDLEVGSFVGEFQIQRVLGEGAMGVVFEVISSDRSLFALKVIRLNPSGSNKTRRERFRREVKAMQRLEHPNIIRVHGYGREGPYDWYVMDRIEGRDLGVLLALGMDVEKKLDLFEQLCEAIVHAHERGVIHRDLKPSNIVVGEDGHLHVLDFGLAKILDLSDSEGAITQSGVSLGTPHYMSPEQFSNPRLVSPRSDVFSLGVILFELVTGQRPFTTTTGNRAWEEPPVPSEVKPGLHRAFDRMILKALELRPDDRQTSAAELLDVLRRHRKAEASRAPASSPGLGLFLLLLTILGVVVVGVLLAIKFGAVGPQ